MPDRDTPCPRCEGAGEVKHTSPYIPSLGLYSHAMLPCPECGGSGRFWTINCDGRYGPLFPRTLPCLGCGGSGRQAEPIKETSDAR